MATPRPSGMQGALHGRQLGGPGGLGGRAWTGLASSPPLPRGPPRSAWTPKAGGGAATRATIPARLLPSLAGLSAREACHPPACPLGSLSPLPPVFENAGLRSGGRHPRPLSALGWKTLRSKLGHENNGRPIRSTTHRETMLRTATLPTPKLGAVQESLASPPQSVSLPESSPLVLRTRRVSRPAPRVQRRRVLGVSHILGRGKGH